MGLRFLHICLMKLAPKYIVWAFMPCSILTHFGTFELLSHIGAALPPGKHDMVRCNMKSGCGGTATSCQIEKLVILIHRGSVGRGSTEAPTHRACPVCKFVFVLL